MNTLKERLEAALKATPGKSKAGMARACKISKPAVSAWLSGQTQSLRGDNLLNAATYLGVNPAWLDSGKGRMSASVKSADSPTDLVWDSGRPLTTRAATRLPVISWEGAAKMLDAENPYSIDDAKDWKDSPFPAGENAFLLAVDGESMYSPDGTGYSTGEIIHVEPSMKPAHDLDVVVRMASGKTIFRRYMDSQEGPYLEAVNPAWPERIIKIQDGMAIIGVVIGSWRDRRKS